MPSVVVTLGQDGKLCGHSDKDQEQFARFQRRVREMQPGETMAFTWKPPRAPQVHRRYFFNLKWLYDNQEAFTDQRIFRKWAEMGAGHCDFVPGPDGLHSIPKTIEYEAMDDDEFRELFNDVMSFFQSARALATLWPDADPMDAWQAVQNVIEARR